MAIGFDSSSSINNSDETLGCKSLPLSCVYLIEDEASKFLHVTCEEESSRDLVGLIGNRRLRYDETRPRGH